MCAMIKLLNVCRPGPSRLSQKQAAPIGNSPMDNTTMPLTSVTRRLMTRLRRCRRAGKAQSWLEPSSDMYQSMPPSRLHPRMRSSGTLTAA